MKRFIRDFVIALLVTITLSWALPAQTPPFSTCEINNFQGETEKFPRKPLKTNNMQKLTAVNF